MADKWASYVITAVRFNSVGTHIESVQVGEHENGERLGTATTHSRADVIRMLEGGYTYCTATKGSDGKWYYGAQVEIVTIDYEKFIKTKADGIKKDNLDNLSRF